MRLFKPSVRTRFLLTYFLLFTLPLLLVGIVSYRRLTNLVAEKTEGSYQTILSRVAQSVDEQLRGLASFTQQLAQLSWMQKLMYMQEKIVGSDRVDPYALEEYQQQFKAYDSANAFVDDIAVFFSGKDFYISSRGKGNLWWLTNFPFRINGMEEAAWTSLLAEDNQQRILPSISMDTYGIERHGLLYVQAIHSPRFPDNRVRATFLAFIRQGELEQFLQVVHADFGISAWIVDAGGAWLAGDPVLAASAPVAGAASARAQSISDATGRRFFLLQSISDLNGWRYFAAVPREVILRHVDQTGMVVVALMVACGIVGWFLSFGLAAMSYRPVSELMRLMQGHQPAARGRRPADEFEWLQGSVRELLGRRRAEAAGADARRHEPLPGQAALRLDHLRR
jgi:hypothetical protein